MECIWLDEARDRARTRFAAMTAAGNGWTGYDDWDDPADTLHPEPEPVYETGAEARAAAVAAFIASVR